ncbi:hypothetical protein BUALT_Bualt19G0060200 [Buddleja alternifolia]|uniref:Uncharacterized protein n=1 Tax=Buddleja alternifolia TaxID=168488 RepID=A0AAV6W5U7_9LAMI|nr:hypothetical protein BUALT_Bualt19G0060200 [Buddleja alternifolia]
MAVESCGDIYALPEDCIANALSLTSPKDACRLHIPLRLPIRHRLGSLFAFRLSRHHFALHRRPRFVACQHRICVSFYFPVSHRSRTQSKVICILVQYVNLIGLSIVFFFFLKRSFSLEKWSGKKCYVLAARDLFIVWARGDSDTPQYWQWISLPESRFAEVAELLSVWWFEIRGKISMKMLSPNTNYAAYLVFKCRATLYGFDDQIAKGNVGSAGQESQTLKIGLDESVAIEGATEYPKRRDDGWKLSWASIL